MPALVLPNANAIKQIKAWLVRPNRAGANVYKRNWIGLCQAFIWQLCYEFGTAPVAYLTAEAARKASGPLNKDAKAAPFGAFHYWDLNGVPADHVGFGLGGDLVLMATSYYDTKWATGLGSVTVANYNRKMAGETYMGWAPVNGKNDVAINSPKPNQRTVGADGSTPRKDPSTKQKAAGASLTPGKIYTFAGWINGQSVSGNKVWFRGTNGFYYWSGGFTSKSTAGLKDLNPPPAPAPKPEPEPKPEPVPEPEPVPTPPATPEPEPTPEPEQPDEGATPIDRLVALRDELDSVITEIRSTE